MKPIFLTVMTFLILGFVIPANGDIPPGPGYKRVKTNVVIEIKEPIPEYRFFLVSGDIAREIFLKPGDKTVVDSPGGGSRYRSGTVVAVPAKNLQAFGDGSGDQASKLEEAVAGGKVGAVKLFDHSFVRDVRDSEARDIRDSAYRIERDKDRVTAVPLSVEEKKSGGKGDVSMGVYDISRSLTPLGWGVIALSGLLIVWFGLRRLLSASKNTHNEIT